MAEAYEEYNYRDQDYKWQRRAKKRHKSLEYLDRKKKKNASSASRKTVFKVNVIKPCGNADVFEIPGDKYVGDPKEFQEIKQMCIEKYGEGVSILRIDTK